ncbi:MAG: hypothetical protein ACREPT_04955, partial [Rudaea sp.]
MLYFVFLRRPRGFDDQRDDPFWEFGSFGRTGCHRGNLMRPNRTPLRDGDRLAFLQGGHREIRMIGLTPPIKIVPTADGIEARWEKSFRPFRFKEAPLFVDNFGSSDFPGIRSALDRTLRSTWCEKAASRFRSRTRPIDEPLAADVINKVAAWEGGSAKTYLDAAAVESEAWHRNGTSEGWGAKRVRESRFLGLGGIPPKAGPAMPKRCGTNKREP